jgi:histidinol phosphatase-like enzyme
MGKPTSRRSKKLVFFDRDGVIIKEVVRSDGTKGSIRFEKEFEYLEHVKETFKFCEDSDFLTVIASNQPDISRKIVSSDFVRKINETILEQLRIHM